MKRDKINAILKELTLDLDKFIVRNDEKEIFDLNVYTTRIVTLVNPNSESMKTKITYEDLIAKAPCYNPLEIGMPKSYSATISEFINEYRNKVKNKEDIIWVVCHEDYMTDRDMRLFAVWCTREALKLVDNPDPKSINACNVAERFANNKATKEEMAAVRDAAWAASCDAGYAVRDAARTTVWAASGDARDAQINELLTYFK